MSSVGIRADGPSAVRIDPESLRLAYPYFDRKQAGQWAPNIAPWGSVQATALTASRALVVRFIAEKTRTITSIKFLLTTAASANDACDAGIFSADGVTLLGSAGTTAGKLNPVAPSVQSLTMLAGIPLTAGQVYYAAFSSGTQGGTAAQIATTSFSQSAIATLAGSAFPLIEQTFQNTAHPLAAPFTSGGAISQGAILFLAE